MKAAVIVFPGSNCDRDMQTALRRTFGAEPLMVWHKDSSFEPVDFIALPGGFSFGDYLRCGAISARSPIMREVIARAGKGVPLLGVCNGFQVLTESNLVPGALIRNRDLSFICKDVNLTVERVDSSFTNAYGQGQIIRIPVSHHDGNYFIDDNGLKTLEDGNQVAFRYCDSKGNASEAANINGSRNNIAGIFNRAGNVMGMMPHPERLCEAVQGGIDGRLLFESIVNALNRAR